VCVCLCVIVKLVCRPYASAPAASWPLPSDGHAAAAAAPPRPPRPPRSPSRPRRRRHWLGCRRSPSPADTSSPAAWQTTTRSATVGGQLHGADSVSASQRSKSRWGRGAERGPTAAAVTRIVWQARSADATDSLGRCGGGGGEGAELASSRRAAAVGGSAGDGTGRLLIAFVVGARAGMARPRPWSAGAGATARVSRLQRGTAWHRAAYRAAYRASQPGGGGRWPRGVFVS
jgi:hypothetical protein